MPRGSAMKSKKPPAILRATNCRRPMHLALPDTTFNQATVLHQVPVLLALAAQNASGAAQKHAPTLRTGCNLGNRQSLHYKRFASAALYQSITCVRKTGRLLPKQRLVEKDGLFMQPGISSAKVCL